MINIPLETLEQTENLAKKIAAKVQQEDVICLQGDLGAGKTTFARFFINSLTENEQEVLSPTFNIVHPYDTQNFTIYHFDLYRLKNANEVEEIGLYDSLDNGVSIIEWPEIINSILPIDRLIVNIQNDDTCREAKLKPYGSWEKRLKDIL